MPKKALCIAGLLVALFAGSCAIFITDTQEPDTDEDDSLTIIIH